jgi:hypothetical protein
VQKVETSVSSRLQKIILLLLQTFAFLAPCTSLLNNNNNNCFFIIAGWFGIRKNFCAFLLTVLPCLQEYGNISWNHAERGQNVPLQLDEFEKYDKKAKKALSKKNDLLKPVVPIISIDLPD